MNNNTNLKKELNIISNNDNTIDYCFHLSDIHIRSGNKNQSRFIEYLNVAKQFMNDLNFYNKLYKFNINKNALVVITGDIFHHKNTIESSGISLFTYLIKNISSICPIILIMGNHDYKQENSDEVDLISSLINNSNYKNIYYLQKTGVYQYNNILFGMVSLLDTLEKGDTSGVTKDLINFPNINDYNINNINKFIKIGLYHGLITNDKKLLTKFGISINWFGDYDYILLGDNHNMQINNIKIEDNNNLTFNNLLSKYDKGYKLNEKINEEQPIWAYSGSMIQQNFGENVYNHGYLLWDFKNKIIKPIILFNKYCFIQIDFEKENINSNNIINIGIKKTLSNSEIIIKNNNYHNLNEFENFIKIYKKFNNYNENHINDDINNNINNIDNDDNNNNELFINIRLINYNFEDYEKLINILKKHNIYHNLSTILNKNNNNNNNENNIEIDNQINLINLKEDEQEKIQMYNTKDIWIEYINNQLNKEKNKEINDKINNNKIVWKEFIYNPENTLMFDTKEYPTSMKDKIDKHNKSLFKLISDYKIIEDKYEKRNIYFKYLEWSWILCFGNQCWIDFDNLKNNINFLNGENGTGKSSLFEILCYALFGTGIPSRYSKEYSSALICQQKPRNEKSYVVLIFELNQEEYLIKRHLYKQSGDGYKLQNKYISVSKKNKENQFIKIKSGSTATANWIKENIGSIEEFLLTIMLTQNCDQDFFNMKMKDQLNLLDDNLNLNKIHLLNEIFKKYILCSKNIGDTLDIFQKELIQKKQNYDVNEPNNIKNEIEEINNNTNNIQNKLIKTIKNIETIKNNYDSNIINNTFFINNFKNFNENEINNNLNKINSLFNKQFLIIPLNDDNENNNNYINNQENNKIINLLKNNEIKDLSKFKIINLNLINKNNQFDNFVKIYNDYIKNNNLNEINLINKLQNLFNEYNIKIKKNRNIILKEKENYLNQKEKFLDNSETNILLKNNYNINNNILDKLFDENLINNDIVEKEYHNFKIFSDFSEYENINQEITKLSNKDIEFFINDFNKFKNNFNNQDNSIDNNNNDNNDNDSNCNNDNNDKYNKYIDKINKKINEETKENEKKLKEYYNEQKELLNKKNNNFEKLLKKNNKKNDINDNIKELINKYYKENNSKNSLKELKKDFKYNKFDNLKFFEKFSKYIYDLDKTNELDVVYDNTVLLQQKRREYLKNKDVFKMLKDQYNDLEKRTKDFPYNPNCEACSKQPWKIELDLKKIEIGKVFSNIDDDLKKIEKIYSEIYKHLKIFIKNTKNSWKSIQEDYKKLIQQNDNFISDYNNLIIFNKFKDFEKIYENINNLLNDKLFSIQIKNEKEFNDDMKIDIINKAEYFFDVLGNLKKKHLVNLITIEDYYKLYNEDLINLNNYKNKINKINESIKNLENDKKNILKQTNNIQKNIENIQSNYNDYFNINNLYKFKNYFSLNEEFKIKLDNSIKYYYKLNYNKELINIILQLIYKKYIFRYNIKDLNDRKTFMKYNEEIEDENNKNIIYKEEIDNNNRYVNVLSIKFNNSKKLIKEQKEIEEKLNNLNNSFNKLINKNEILNIISEMFLNYKSWLYKNKIFPIIIEKTNCIISELRNIENEIKLEILWKKNLDNKDSKSKNIDDFSDDLNSLNDCVWLINDSKNKPPINKASGFQRFIIGLAMRITLSSLGVSKISNNQLFIDEGFTSFDKDNLRYVPDFIEKLLLLYPGGILLVSHLEKITSGSSNNLVIEHNKEKKLSNLIIGKKYNYELI
jgi:hypothetical protein